MKVKRLKTNNLLFAYRNIYRHKTKTIITTFAIAIGVGAYLVLDAWLLGMNIDSKRNLVNFETGSSRIYSKKYFENKDELPLYESFNNYNQIINKLDNAGYDAVPHAVFVGSLFSNNSEFPFKFIGVDPKVDGKIFKYNEWFEKGTNSRFVEDNKFEIALGVKGAKDLGVNVGDVVRLSTVIDKKDETGKIKHINQLIELTVCGLINTTDPVTNGYIGYLPLSILQDDQGLLLDGYITDLSIRKKNASVTDLPSGKENPKVIKKILGNTLPDELIVVGWQEDAKDYIAASSGDNIYNRLFIVFFFIITLVGIANTMLMAVLERTKEIGMLKALGMTDFSVVKLFLTEAGLLGFIGSIIGIIISIPFIYYLIYHGVDYTDMIEKTGVNNFGYRVLGIFKAAWNFPTMFCSIIVVSFISSLTAFFPSMRAIKIKIVEALRFE